MTFRLRSFLLCLCLGSFSGCQVNNEALRTEVLNAVLPDTQCAYTTTNTGYTSGYYDPTVDGGMGYSLALVLRNNMMAAADNPVAAAEITNINSRAHDVQVTSFDGCWFNADDEAAYGGTGQDAKTADCNDLPEQRGRMLAFANVEEGGGLGLIQLRVLDLTALRQIFGTDYTPSLIPTTGKYTYLDPSVNPLVANGNQTSAVRSAYAFAPEDPVDLVGRSVYWGAKYPAQRDAAVIVQLRANMVTQSGEHITGNWFRFPITVCTGCLQDYCGPLVEEVCAKGPCSDGTECLSTGLCANSSLTCAPVTLYSGSRPDFYGASGTTPCLPAQGFTSTTPLTCTPVGCQATN